LFTSSQRGGRMQKDADDNCHTMEPMVPFTLRLPSSLRHKVEQAAAHRSVSRASVIREALAKMFSETGDIPTIRSDEPHELWRYLDPAPSLQVTGDIGIGKTTLVKETIRRHEEVKWVVIDSHGEYTDLPKKDVIAPDPRFSYRIVPPRARAAAEGLFPLYVNQILSRRWPTSMILVVEEAHRYADLVAGLLAECRKFVKVLTVSPSRLVDYVPAVRVVR